MLCQSRRFRSSIILLKDSERPFNRFPKAVVGAGPSNPVNHTPPLPNRAHLSKPPTPRRRISVQSMATAQQFFPPIGMQESLWNSTTHGNFIDAKIFAFSRRSSNRPTRVHSPRALFVNTHVLATACTFFRSSKFPLLSKVP